MLAPFIVCQWFGNEWEVPGEFARHVERTEGGMENTFFVVMDAGGQVVDSFPSVPDSDMRGAKERILGRLEKVRRTLGLEEKGLREIRLPDIDGSPGAGPTPAGIRVVVRNLVEDKPGADSPVFELVRTRPEDWAPFAYPEATKTIGTDSIASWLDVAYPPARFEMVGQASFPNEILSGALSFSPAGDDGERRYALAVGDLELVLEGLETVEYGGRIKIVFTYDLDSSQVRSARGVILGTYPSYDVGRRSNHETKFAALFESRPAR